jgi:hypothetical protein
MGGGGGGNEEDEESSSSDEDGEFGHGILERWALDTPLASGSLEARSHYSPNHLPQPTHLPITFPSKPTHPPTLCSSHRHTHARAHTFLSCHRQHTMRSFMAYAEWSKLAHFQGPGIEPVKMRGSWVPVDWGSTRKKSAPAKKRGGKGGRGGGGKGGGRAAGAAEDSAKEEGEGEEGEDGAENEEAPAPAPASTPAPATAATAGSAPAGKVRAPRAPRAAKPSGPELSIEQLESEFWRIVENPPGLVETLYGSDLDSGRWAEGGGREWGRGMWGAGVCGRQGRGRV